MSKRDVYIAKVKAQIDEINAQMSRIQVKALETREDMRDKYRAEIDKLEKQSAHAVAKLEEIKAAGEDRWEALVGEMDKIGDACKDAFKAFKARF